MLTELVTGAEIETVLLAVPEPHKPSPPALEPVRLMAPVVDVMLIFPANFRAALLLLVVPTWPTVVLIPEIATVPPVILIAVLVLPAKLTVDNWFL